jgi:hypothetical protein
MNQVRVHISVMPILILKHLLQLSFAQKLPSILLLLVYYINARLYLSPFTPSAIGIFIKYLFGFSFVDPYARYEVRNPFCLLYLINTVLFELPDVGLCFLTTVSPCKNMLIILPLSRSWLFFSLA